LPRAVEHIVSSAQQRAASADARQKLPPEQNAARVAITQQGIQQGVDRERVLQIARFLNEPLARFMQRQLRGMYLAYEADRDIAKLVGEVDELRRRYESAEARREDQEPAPGIAPQDVHLVCFEYVS